MAALSDRRHKPPAGDVDSHNSADSIPNGHHEKPRRAGLRHRPARQRSLTRDISHVAAETYLITHLALTLLRYLGYCFQRFFLLQYCFQV